MVPHFASVAGTRGWLQTLYQVHHCIILALPAFLSNPSRHARSPVRSVDSSRRLSRAKRGAPSGRRSSRAGFAGWSHGAVPARQFPLPPRCQMPDLSRRLVTA